MRLLLTSLLLFLLLNACRENDTTLFTRLDESRTGINFRNLLQEDNPDFNILAYPYFYNGSGVAVGDINNDGLPDLCFTGNMVKNRLFINKGDFNFEDITAQSHIADKEGWCTGVTMVDINNDGWLDIYICRSGLPNTSYRRNLLFINNHDLTFTERAAEYGLDDPGYSTQAAFFDYDKDGDLDMVLINQSSPQYSKGNIDFIQSRRLPADSLLGNKLYRNDNGHFVNVTRQAGIVSNVLTYSLGVSTADINQDGWPDIYITNDFKEPDHLYINNHDGTFTEQLKQKLDHISLYSMGVDIADYNNDLLPDIIEPDMLPEGNRAQKMHMGADNYNQYNYLFNAGMPFQYMKNSLQKNNGDGSFSEIGQLAGVSATDWSWSPLLADYDNDGMKDLFITNGYKRDNTDMQFIVYSLDQARRMAESGRPLNTAEYISHMPGILLPNYMYRNTGNDHFENATHEWGFDAPGISNGAVYADLDNDGDLDLVTSNMDEYAGVYRNNSRERLPGNHYIKLKLQGARGNAAGIGSKIYLYAGDKKIYLEQQPVRGFQSCMDPVLHAGLGSSAVIDSLRIIWPDDKTQLLRQVKADQELVLDIAHATGIYDYNRPAPAPYFALSDIGPGYTHRENPVNDFNRQYLLPQCYSHNGPCMAKGDINGDGLEDVYVGGAKGHPGSLFVQDKNGGFRPLAAPALLADSLSEDTDAIFFDADGDKDLDLYVVSGGYDYEAGDPLLEDRLYLNDGHGHFTRALHALPLNRGSKSCVRACDIDGDGDMDLFVGGKVVPGKWPASCASSIYINDGKGHFTDQTDKCCAALKTIGIVTDAVWADVNNDHKKDLIVVGEWMAPMVFLNNEGKLEPSHAELSGLSGWWNTILAGDFDHDGDTDLVMGNFGLNSALQSAANEPVELYATDIDGNGSIDPIMTSYVQGQSYPFAFMDDINSQVPSLKKVFNDYSIYAGATIKDIIPGAKLHSIKPLRANTFKTIYLENTGKGFVERALPMEVQYAPVYVMVKTDVNKDGKDDLILFGNNNCTRIRLARQDANHGTVLLGDGKGNFRYLPPAEHGISVRGDTRSCMMINNTLLVGVNNQPVKAYKLR